jgi:glycerol 2-dehydrogenase (NADP+)
VTALSSILPDNRPKLLAYCASKNIHCTAYSCLGGHSDSPINGQTNLTKDPVILEVAESKKKTPAQILYDPLFHYILFCFARALTKILYRLQWNLRRGVSVIPKSVTPSRIENNYDLEGWDITEDEFERITAIKTRAKVVGDSWMPIRVFLGDDE